MCADMSTELGNLGARARNIGHPSKFKENSKTDSTENATPPKSTRPRNSKFSVQIQITPKSQIVVVPRDTGKNEFLDLVDCGDVAI